MNRRGEMIRYLCDALDVLFSQVAPEHILTGDKCYDNFTCQDVGALLAERYQEKRTRIESDKVTECLNRYMAGRDGLRLRRTRRTPAGVLHVFELLSDVAEHLLRMDNGEAICYYNYILQWRELVRSIGEELPVTAMYVISDLFEGKDSRSKWDWDCVIGHNNEPLNQIMRRGISDHHLHLWVSMPYFQVAWVNLMNHVANTEFTRYLNQIDEEDWTLKQKKRWKDGVLPERKDSLQKDALAVMHLQAALIRIYLCARLKGQILYIAPCNKVEDKKKEKERETNCCELTYEEYKKVACEQNKTDLDHIYFLLNEPQQIFVESRKIQNIIASFQGPNMHPYLDYAHYISVGNVREDKPIQLAFGGERWFLYHMLKDTYLTFPKLERGEHNLFYAYLMLQMKIRRKLVQTDAPIGFDYFQKIQKRKGYFINDSASVDLVMRLAVQMPLSRKPYLLELEARISPRENAEELANDIMLLENACEDEIIPAWGEKDNSLWIRLRQADLLWKELDDEKTVFSRMKEVDSTLARDFFYHHLLQEWSEEQKSIKDRFYYVLHFTKEQDNDKLKTKEKYTFNCRHAVFREKLNRQAEAILALRTHYPQQAMRVLGIDACSQEIGCRPENFAYVFRLLSSNICTWNDCGTTQMLPKLRMTYHVGEDFLDLADGLRAIDEAVRFLNLDCGDRLGHAIALSYEPEKWYEDKDCQIFLPEQDYLDNLAWLYYSIHHYHLSGLERESRYLKQEFECRFREIYLNHIEPEEMRGFMRLAVEQYEKAGYRINASRLAQLQNHDMLEEYHLSDSYQIRECNFTIEDYSRSWMLRGDDPKLYRSGYFYQDEVMQGIDERERWKQNERFPADLSVRYIPECSYLNFCYHYNVAIRRAGRNNCTVKVDERYIRAVKAVQHALQFDISRRGISVEGNPTSNLRISPLKSYEEHPLTNLFNRGLYHSDLTLRNCPQVPVSINTDDGGLFFTSLENEYAVIARALEMRAESGNESFFRWEIHDWIEAIRKNGNAQSFREQNK